MVKKTVLIFIFILTCLISTAAFAEDNAVTTCTNGLTVTTAQWEEETFKAKYPEVYIPGNPVAGDRINATVKELITEGLKSAELSWKKEGESTYSVDYIIACPNIDNLLSFNFSHYVYDGTEKPHFFFSGMTFDTTTGKMMTWRELVKPEDKIWFNTDAISSILREEEKIGTFYLFTDFKGLDSLPTNYYLDSYGTIHFQWAPGVIAPYKAGVIDISTGRATKYSTAVG